jgi:hypothetical protein
LQTPVSYFYQIENVVDKDEGIALLFTDFSKIPV